MGYGSDARGGRVDGGARNVLILTTTGETAQRDIGGDPSAVRPRRWCGMRHRRMKEFVAPDEAA
jgi:hypothetical protein